MAPTDLYDAAAELVLAADVALTATPGGVATRRFVSPGVPAWDVPNQLTVHVGGPVIADTLPLQPPLQPLHRSEIALVNLVQLVLTIVREVPVTQQYEGQVQLLPAAVHIDAAAQATLADLWAIWNYLLSEKRKELLFPPKSREFILDPAVPLPITGGFGGWQIPVRVQLGGYRVGT